MTRATYRKVENRQDPTKPYCVEWQSDAMSAPAFEYFETLDEAVIAVPQFERRPMTLTELDSLRAHTMRRLLNEEGRQEIWKYDIVESRVALGEAVERQNYDDMVTGQEAIRAGKRYALIGGGICDHYFTTPEELVKLVEWLCRDGGYLSCYKTEAVTS